MVDVVLFMLFLMLKKVMVFNFNRFFICVRNNKRIEKEKCLGVEFVG